MRNAFINELEKYAKNNKKIQLVTGDLGFGVLDDFSKELPNQFINAGIEEQSMMGIAAGMALEGNIVFVYSIANFPTIRCLEQIRNDCAYHNANVKIVTVGGGMVYGSMGMSHHATEDLSIMRALPNVSVFAPADPIEAKSLVKQVINKEGTCYIRLGKGGEKPIHQNTIENYEIGKAIKLFDGSDIAIFSTGAIINEAISVKDSLKEKNINASLYTFPTVKPIDEIVIKECMEKHKMIVTIEENNIIGGFGSAVAEVMSMYENKCKLLRFGLHDTYASIVGNQEFLRMQYGLNSEYMVETILNKIRN